MRKNLNSIFKSLLYKLFLINGQIEKNKLSQKIINYNNIQ